MGSGPQTVQPNTDGETGTPVVPTGLPRVVLPVLPPEVADLDPTVTLSLPPVTRLPENCGHGINRYSSTNFTDLLNRCCNEKDINAFREIRNRCRQCFGEAGFMNSMGEAFLSTLSTFVFGSAEVDEQPVDDEQIAAST